MTLYRNHHFCLFRCFCHQKKPWPGALCSVSLPLFLALSTFLFPISSCSINKADKRPKKKKKNPLVCGAPWELTRVCIACTEDVCSLQWTSCLSMTQRPLLHVSVYAGIVSCLGSNTQWWVPTFRHRVSILGVVRVKYSTSKLSVLILFQLVPVFLYQISIINVFGETSRCPTKKTWLVIKISIKNWHHEQDAKKMTGNW